MAKPTTPASAPIPVSGKLPAPAVPAAPAVPIAGNLPAPAASAAPAVPAVVLGSKPVPLAAGQQAVACGVSFIAPVAGNYAAPQAANAGWPCYPTGHGYVVRGTAPVAPNASAGAVSSPATVLVLPLAASSGNTGPGARAGHYKAWPYYGPALLHLPQ